jgi:hypothetical protein
VNSHHGLRNGKTQNKSHSGYRCTAISLTQVFKRHAEIGCIAAALGPKNKVAKYFEKAGVVLPANIPLEEWDPFHDFIVISLGGCRPTTGER